MPYFVCDVPVFKNGNEVGTKAGVCMLTHGQALAWHQNVTLHRQWVDGRQAIYRADTPEKARKVAPVVPAVDFDALAGEPDFLVERNRVLHEDVRVLGEVMRGMAAGDVDSVTADRFLDARMSTRPRARSTEEKR